MKNTNFFSFIEKLYKAQLGVVNYFQNLKKIELARRDIELTILAIILLIVFIFAFYLNFLRVEENPNPVLGEMSDEEKIIHTFTSSYFFPIDKNILETTLRKSLVEEPYLEDVYIPEVNFENLKLNKEDFFLKKNLYFIVYEQFTKDFFNFYFSFFLFPHELINQITLEAKTWNKDIIIYSIFYKILFEFYLNLNSFNLSDKLISNFLVDINNNNIIYNFSIRNAIYNNFNSETSPAQITDLFDLCRNDWSLTSSVFFTDFVFQTLKNSIINQIFYLQIVNFFIKKKIFLFFFINFIIFTLMLVNLTKLYKAINLIYALLHFLIFAILSGLLILLWGSSYIAFCVLLIYGAAIPVLALYIIMLVNVDLIQRLFFFEHISNKSFSEKRKKFFFSIFFIIFLLLSFKDINTILQERKYPWLAELMKDVFLTNLTERYLASNHFSYKNTTIYDLVLSFYSSDIDKVASLAFKTSYNELLALVFLLLIAIIVVISISRSQIKTISNTYDTVIPNYLKFKKNFDFMTEQTLFKFLYIQRLHNFLKLKALPELQGAKLHSLHNPIYIYHYIYQTQNFTNFDHRTKDMYTRLAVDPEPNNPKDPWTEWYKVYAKECFIDELEKKTEVWKFLYDEIDFMDRESFTKEEIFFYRAVHRTLI